jgi:hypothetical protein
MIDTEKPRLNFKVSSLDGSNKKQKNKILQISSKENLLQKKLKRIRNKKI